MDNKSKWISLLLSSDGFVVINKALIKVLGLNAAVLIGELVSEYNYYEKVEKLVDDTWFYSTSANIEENTGLTRFQQEQTIIHLQELKIIDIKKMGIPCKRYFSLNFDQLEQILQNCQKDAKKPLKSQFARNSQTSMQVDEENAQNIANNENDYQINAKKPLKSQFARNSQTCMSETSKQDCQKLAINNNNKTIINNSNNISNHISSEQGAEKDKKTRNDGISVFNRFEEFKKRAEFDVLLNEWKDNKAYLDILKNIVDIIYEIYTSKNQYILMNSIKRDINDIRDILDGYDKNTIIYVIESIYKNTTKIKNIKAYIIKTLYNAPKTINIFTQNNIKNENVKKNKTDKYSGIEETFIYGDENKKEYNPLEFSLDRVDDFMNLSSKEIQNKHHGPPVPA